MVSDIHGSSVTDMHSFVAKLFGIKVSLLSTIISKRLIQLRSLQQTRKFTQIYKSTFSRANNIDCPSCMTCLLTLTVLQSSNAGNTLAFLVCGLLH